MWIDNQIQIWNEVLQELYAKAAFTGEVKEGTITLATGVREYAIATDFEQFTGDVSDNKAFINSTVPHVLYEYPGGYEKMYADQPNPAIFTGRPAFYAINKTNGKIRVDSTPTSSENGEIYTYLYDKRISLSSIGDVFPVSDTVVDAMIPVIVEVFRQDKDARARTPIYALTSFGRALSLASQNKARRKYGYAYSNPIDPEVI